MIIIEPMKNENKNIHYDEILEKTIILDETDIHNSERYFHFVCEMK